jgi:hypothetical protein
VLGRHRNVPASKRESDVIETFPQVRERVTS